MTESLQVIVLAAGKSLRMKSETPKVLHSVCGKTILERVLRVVAALSPSRIVVVLGRDAERVQAQVDALATLSEFSSIEFRTVVQGEQLGTGHATQIGLNGLSENCQSVLVLPGDIPLIKAQTLHPALKIFREASPEILVVSMKPENPFGYGRLLRETSGKLLRIVEEKDCKEEERKISEVNCSVYLSKRSCLELALKEIDSANAQGEYYLTDIVSKGVEKGYEVLGVPIENPRDILGVNSRMELAQVERIRRSEIIERWMSEGVSFEDPASVYLDEDVVLGRDVWIGAGSRLRGRTIVEDGVFIEGDTLIKDSRIGKGAYIKLACYIVESEVGPHCQIGPFTHLRPESELKANVKVGNFVEIKKSELGPGAKVNHLSYIGDAKIGQNVNVGAGTITCNYDGVNKHQTVIESEAFIGSNTCLVAPVKIGAGAYVGAGSTISKDVPAGSLGVARARQVVHEGWVNKKKNIKQDR